MARDPGPKKKIPVLIIGGGPVGLALAVDLGWRGVECTVVEQAAGTIESPRTFAISARTMEFCRRWGVAETVRTRGLSPDFPRDALYLTSLNGYEIARIERPEHGGDKPSAFSPERQQICAHLAPILSERIADFSNVTLRYRCRFESFENTESGVIADAVDLATDTRERIAARYLVDCGGRGPVRQALGIEMEGNPLSAHQVHILFRCPDFLSCHDMGRAALYYFLSPEGVWATLLPVDGEAIWRVSINAPTDGAELPPAEIDRRMRQIMGADFAYEVISVIPWVRREMVAKSFQQGGVFVAGDSVHQISPEGGHGMNTGVGDAVDLGWKLAATLAGWAGPGLLASYETERRPVAQRNLQQTSRNVRNTAFQPVAAVGEDTAEGERERLELGDRFRRDASRRHQHFGMAFGHRYHPSPICWPEETAQPTEDLGNYAPGTRPGERAPHAFLADGRSTIDLFGEGFTLLRLGAEGPEPAPFSEAAVHRGVPFQAVAIDDPEICTLYERNLVLVRPDGHVAWRGDVLPTDAMAVIDHVRGAGVIADAAPAQAATTS